MKIFSKLTKKEPLFHIVKRSDIKPYKAWIIRIVAGLSAFLVCGIVAVLLSDCSFGQFYKELFKGVFGTERRIWNMLQNTMMLLIVALAVTPAFKMRFWNIGAEGQVLIGALCSAACAIMIGDAVNESVLILIMFASSVVGGIIWAVIPAIFKAKWNTNETLFTLMMNYIAIHLVKYCINLWAPNGSGTVGIINNGHFPKIGGQAYLLNIILVIICTAIVFVYMRYSKQGYEISVVGESENTAKYIGINVKKVIIRTMVFSGIICGLAGLLLVGGTHHTINADLVEGRGFTAILVSWLAKFNPLAMIGTSFLVIFFQQGSAQVATSASVGMTSAFSDIMVGIFFFFIIGCEFFINYNVVSRLFKKKNKSIAKNDDENKEKESLKEEITEENDVNGEVNA